MLYQPNAWVAGSGGQPNAADGNAFVQRMNDIEQALDVANSAYVAKTWSNPTTGTPLSADWLNHLEAGVAAAAAAFSRIWFDVTDYGAVGDGNADDTAAVQAAVNAALAASDPANVQQPKSNGLSPIVYFPLGTYSVNQITIAGSVKLVGSSTFAYASSTLRQRAAGQNILYLAADTDGTSNATQIENLCFRSTSGTSNASVANIKTAPGIGSNSVYIRNCWFATPETYAIWITQGDDIQITDCTFDVAAFYSIRIGGSSSSGCSNVVISRSTFYNIALRCIELTNVSGIVIAENRAYASSGANFIETNGASQIGNLAATGNHIDGLSGVAKFAGGTGIVFTGNAVKNCPNPFVFEGGGIVYGVTIVGNSFNSAGAMSNFVYANGTGLQVSVIAHNSILPGATSPFVFNASDSRVTGNVFNQNATIRFNANNNFAPNTSNGV